MTKIKAVIADVKSKKALEKVFADFRPQVVFHAAAYKHVPLMEENPSQAILTNVKGTKNIVNAAKTTNSKIIYMSTDYVFDGKKGMYKENDESNPINYYGKTKLEGEKSWTSKSEASMS